MYFTTIIISLITIIILYFVFNVKINKLIICILSSIIISLIVSMININSKTLCKEIWSGTIVEVKHKEEWDEWHDPVYETREIKNSDGKVIDTKKVKIRDGYWEHHPAVNSIKTSDDGWKTVNTNKDGTIKFDDKYPNNDKELETFWNIGLPTASIHTYKNKVQASYSIYNFEDVDLEKYPGLPEYPKTTTNYINIDRILGDVPNKIESLETLAIENSKLNVMIYDDEQKKNKSYKEVNIMFVNLGDVSIDHGYALESYWKGGNKNDFIVAFGSDENFNITWAYPITWSESELLKINVRDYMLDQKEISDFKKIVLDISTMVEGEFIRKEFTDFEYLNIEISLGAKVLIWILTIIAFFIILFLDII